MRPACSILALLLAVGSPAAAPPASATRPAAATISDALLAELDHDDYRRRDAALLGLLRDDSLTPAAVAAAYARAGTLEQRHRLREVARHHFLRNLAATAPAPDPLPAPFPAPDAVAVGGGSIGLSQTGVPAGSVAGLSKPAVRVVFTFPGFPAHAHLQPGDLLLGVNGSFLSDGPGRGDGAGEFGAMVAAHRPGARVKLHLLRAGKPMDVDLSLGRLDALRAMYDPAFLELRDAYREALEGFERSLETSARPLAGQRVLPPATQPGA